MRGSIAVALIDKLKNKFLACNGINPLCTLPSSDLVLGNPMAINLKQSDQS
jgi:hypothetical protein